MTPESELLAARRILVITHIAPDGDAIGGLLALGHALRRLGKEVTLACFDVAPKRFAYLPGYSAIVNQAAGPYDLMVSLDCSDMRRVGRLDRADDGRAVPFLNIDHHVTNTRFGTYNWVDPSCVATSEMVLELCDRLGVAMDAEMAQCLLYGILGDTQGLRTDNVTPALLGKVIRLLEAGAPPLAQVMDQIFGRRPFNLIRAWEKALETMQLDQGVVWAFLTRQARGQAGWNDTDLQGLSNFLIAADEASLAAVFVEKDDGRVEVGMRARAGYDVARIALSFGGGGHPQAAGCEMDGPLEAAIERVVASLKARI